MKVKQIARLLAIVLTLVTMVSCLAVFMATETSAAKGSGYVVYTGKQLHANNQYGGITHKSDNGDNSWTFTSASNDPTIQIDGLLSADGFGTNVLKSYPYIVIRYQTTSFTSMQIFYRSSGGQDFRNAAMPVAPVATGKWGVLFYDFNQSFKNDIDWFRLDPCTDSGVTMTIAEIAFFTTQDRAQTYANVYASAGTGNSVSVMNAGNFTYTGNWTGYTHTGGAGGSSVSSIFEMSFVHNDHYIATKDGAGNWTRHDGATSQAFTKDGAVFTRITANGNDAWLEYKGTDNIFVKGFRTYKKFAVRYRIPDKNINNQSQSVTGVSMQIYYASNGGYTGAQVQSKSLTSDNQWHWVFFDFSSVSRTSYDSIRFDFMTKSGSFDVAEIYFYNDDYDVYNAVVGSASLSRAFTNCYPCGGNCKVSANLVTNPIHYFLHKSDSNVYFTSVGTVPGGSLAGKHRSSTGSSFVYGSSSISTVGRTFYIREGTHSAHDESYAVTAATCQKAGNTRYTCKLCNDIRDVAIAQLSHNSGRDEITTQPTCVDTGVRTYYCTNGCGQAQKTETVAATGIHDSNKSISAVAATCTATGLTAGKNCSVCNKVMEAQQTVPKLPHTEVTDAAVAATCTKTGLTEGCHCSVCSTVITAQKVTDKLPHTEAIDARIEPDCTNTGLTAGCHCSVCSTVIKAQEVIDALGHNEVIDAAVAPTCTAAGLEAGKHCDRCDEILLPQVPVDALGHEIIETPEVKPTYTTVGHKAGSSCSRCDEVDVVGEEIPKLCPILTYNIALNEKFALNVLYAHFDENAALSVNGVAYDGEIKDTGSKDDFGNPIYSIRIPDISARDINTGFLVQEVSQGESVTVSIASYCTAQPEYFEQQKQALINQKVEGGMSVEDATAAAEAELRPQMLAADVCNKITVYGQAAENYFNPGDTTDKHTALAGQITAYTPQNTTKAASNTGDVKFMSATVLYGDEIELVFIMDNYKREKIFVNDVEIPENEINSHLFKTTVGGKEYICFAIVVKPDEFSKTFTVRAGSWVMGEDGNNYYAGGSTASYSVDTYIANMQQKYAGQTDAKALSTLNLVNALGNYGHSASTYAKN